jgi:hypothetical protein
MKIAWLPLIVLVACATEEPVVDSTTEPGSSSTDAPTTDAPTTDTPTTDAPTSDAPTTDDPSTTTDDPSTTTEVDPDSSSGDDSSSDDGSTTGPIPVECQGIEMIELQDPFVAPIEAKAWTAGGSVEVGVTMYNPGPDFTNYPSIIVEADDPLVTSGMPNNSLFAILEGMSTEIFVVFEADDAVEPGTEVTFTISMATLDQPCPNGDSIEVTATVE